MFHKNNEPITITQLDEIFYNVKIKRNFIEESIFNDDRSNIYFYSMNFYSSIPYNQIVKQYDYFINNMSMDDYLFMNDNGYADSLAQYEKLPNFVFTEFIEHPDYVPPLAYDNENKYNL